MELEQRAKTALKMLIALLPDEDANQDQVDFLGDVIERDGLWHFYTDDSGEPFNCYKDFVEQANAEADAINTPPVASAGGSRPLCEMTPAERRAARLAANR